MADIDITQAEADALMAMEKRCADEKEWLFPIAGDRLAIPLTSIDKRENFVLDINRGQITLTKATYENRARAAIILMRLDIDGPPHRNPGRRRNLVSAPPHLSGGIWRQVGGSGPHRPIPRYLGPF